MFAFNLRFPGQYYDAETGKHYNYFRDFDPAIGRYVESDPIGLRGGLNTYGYVRANPLQLIDKFGLFTLGQCCGGSGSGGGGNGVGQQVANACKMVANNVKDPALRQCINNRCDNAHVSCDGLICRITNSYGWHSSLANGEVNLCVKGNDFVSQNGLWGCVAVHEWAHSCGWGHGGGVGVPDGLGDCMNWRSSPPRSGPPRGGR